MSSTSQALGPNEPPAPPNWVMTQPYRRRSGLMGSPGSVCPANELSRRPPLHHAAGSRSRAQPRWCSSTDRSTGVTASGWRCAGCPSSPRWPTTVGVTRAPGAAGSWTRGARRGSALHRARGAGAGRRSAGGRGAQPGGQRRDRSRAVLVPGPSTPLPRSSRRCRGWASAARGGRPWPALSDDPGEEAERFFTRMVGDGAWSRLNEKGRAERRADGPALVADLRGMRVEGPPSTSPRWRCPPCSAVAALVGRPTTAGRSSGWAPTSLVPSSMTSSTPNTVRTCRTRTISPPCAPRCAGKGPADQADEKGGSPVSLTVSCAAWCGCFNRRDSISSYRPPCPRSSCP